MRPRDLVRVAATLACLATVPVHAAEVSVATDDVSLPPGYVIEPVVTGLTFPTSMTVGPDGAVYVAEAGYSYGAHWAESRIVRVGADGRAGAVAYGFRGPIMGLTFRDNLLYVSHRGAVSVLDFARVNPARHVRDVVTGLPVLPNGSHFNSRVAFGPDGKMYFAVGTPTNSGVPDATDVLFGWLLDFPWMRDAPARDVALTGSNYPNPDVLGPNPLGTLKIVRGGAYLPFGTPSRAGQVIPGHRMPTGAVYRANPDGTGLEVYASGIRSPYTLAYGPDGRLYMTNHEMDDRGARPVANAPDSLLEVRQNAWYGWPDYVAGTPITDPRFNPRSPTGRRPGFVMQNHPEVQQPLMRFEPHAAITGFDWSTSDRFGFRGEMFMAEFGSGEPLTTGLKPAPPAGFRVSRVNVAAGTQQPFMTVRNPGMASTRGPKHPIDVRFDATGDNLYVLDFGVMTTTVSLNQVGINPLPKTGTLWRIRRADAGGAPRPVQRIEGGKLLSWWTVRQMVLLMHHDLRTGIAHSRWLRRADLLMERPHREGVRDALDSVRTLATLALKRIDEPDVVDNGTRTFLIALQDWATRRVVHGAFEDLDTNDPMVRELERWLRENDFPEREDLRRNYAVPGRWQRPVEADVLP